MAGSAVPPATGLPDGVEGYGLGPEWVPGPDGVPFRRAARVILLDGAGRVLLLRGHDSAEPTRSWWFTVGGGLAAGEDPRLGAVRELHEETALRIAPTELEGPVLTRSAVFDFALVTCRQDEQFFLARGEETRVDVTGWTELEQQVIDELRWWDVDDLDTAVADGVTVYPRELPGLVRRLRDGWDGTTPHVQE